ncbi:MAG: hypothetical protein ACLR7D_07560 [Lachnospira eligens]
MSLLMYMENELEYSDLYMFNTQLQTTTGIHVQLPLLFAEYTFAEKKDIDEYIELLCDVDGYFENMVHLRSFVLTTDILWKIPLPMR